ncbi:uncharacterized protein MAM_04532 [Metarhizium album ARSEF 1941]|uniref:Uncharacterized protein n=1 Tax=Metarhizium album (strain ARSEF 1941) TaxID=1081103 RepID=A0A0B2WVN6_METAS|nr:uncharacterized protein MAM_04532 [Metarhizium album ARSEF 1941]KHN97517.1 hypothetical protein MAM_04532 [Metarhizium album ARSEF 1941]
MSTGMRAGQLASGRGPKHAQAHDGAAAAGGARAARDRGARHQRVHQPSRLRGVGAGTLRAGHRVVPQDGRHGPQRRGGSHGRRRAGRTGGRARHGALSEYVVVPRAVDPDVAAAVGTARLPAYQSVRPYVKPGGRVFSL